MSRDHLIVRLIAEGRLVVDAENVHVYATFSNTPEKPAGATTKKGYLRICVTINGKQHHFMAHRVVWVSVHGPLKPGHFIDHGPAGKACNRIDNLDAVTNRENMRRAVRDKKFAGVGRRDGIRDEKGRFGKARAGRLLDGIEHNGMPEMKT